MRSAYGWVLVSTVQQGPCVLLAGGSPKNNAPLESFFRGNPHRSTLARVVSDCRLSAHLKQVKIAGDSVVIAKPVVSERGQVHGVWLQITAEHDRTERLHPPAWAFTWDLEQRTATRPVLLHSTSDGERIWSIAEALEHVELGDQTVATLAMVINRRPSAQTFVADAVMHIAGVEQPRVVRFSAYFDKRGGSSLYGLTYDVGPHSHSLNQRRIGEIVADAPDAPGTKFRVVMDMHTLDFVYWYGAAPTDVAWRLSHYRALGPCIHPDDTTAVRSAISEVLHSTSGRAVQEKLRLRHTTGEFAAYEAIISNIDLDDETQAILMTLSATQCNSESVHRPLPL